jgi:hypothetical protein
MFGLERLPAIEDGAATASRGANVLRSLALDDDHALGDLPTGSEGVARPYGT